MTRKEAKKAFGQIEYPEDKIGTIFFATVKENNMEVGVRLIQKGDYLSTIDEIFNDNPNSEILFKKDKIFDKGIECLKNNGNLATDLINEIYLNTTNEEHKKFIKENNYLENIDK